MACDPRDVAVRRPCRSLLIAGTPGRRGRVRAGRVDARRRSRVVPGGAAPRLAAEGDQLLEAAAGTADPGEAAAEEPAVEIAAQVALHVGWEPAAGRAPVSRSRQERLEPVAHHRMEQGLLRLATSVPGERRRSQVSIGSGDGAIGTGHRKAWAGHEYTPSGTFTLSDRWL
jgi:hypothetical protein